MFPYWNAPPSLLRAWAESRDPDPVPDDKVHFTTLIIRAREAVGDFLGQMPCYLRALRSWRTADSWSSSC